MGGEGRYLTYEPVIIRHMCVYVGAFSKRDDFGTRIPIMIMIVMMRQGYDTRGQFCFASGRHFSARWGLAMCV